MVDHLVPKIKIPKREKEKLDKLALLKRSTLLKRPYCQKQITDINEDKTPEVIQEPKNIENVEIS